ncbi:hypothetical protein B0H14DRAFT_2626336 [Mycena olivaceomarginata]|nr:hypothetical protein B0H14DRAFT_2626336 [Mycena olivaceomarginata]
MAQTDTSTTIAPTSQQELGALVSKVTALSKLTLDMTRLCIEVNDALPTVVQGQVAAALAAAVPSVTWYHSAAPLPDEIDAMFPPGLFDNEPWHVVCIGRRPGLYASYMDADDQVRNVPSVICCPGRFSRPSIDAGIPSWDGGRIYYVYMIFVNAFVSSLPFPAKS